MSMTIEQVLGLNNRAVFFSYGINEARYLLAIRLARAATSGPSALTCAACVGTVRQDER